MLRAFFAQTDPAPFLVMSFLRFLVIEGISSFSSAHSTMEECDDELPNSPLRSDEDVRSKQTKNENNTTILNVYRQTI